MSTLRGEQSLKKPLSFEFYWAARHLLEVMEERAGAIILGGLPGESGVDFRVSFADHEEHHQVKRSFGTKGEWTLSALGEVLADFKQRLADPGIHCWFVSAIPAVRLGYLGDRARDSADLEAFESSWLTGEYRGRFDELVQRWALPRDECWNRLRRVHTAAFDERRLESECLSLLRTMVVSRPEDALAHLRDFCFDHTHRRVTASEVWQWLATRGVERQIVEGDSRILVRIAEQTREYLHAVRQKLIKPPLPRETSSMIVNALASATRGDDAVVLGAPGGGKSAVMLQIADACIAKGWPVLAFRLDELSATTTRSQLQEALGLPLSPAAAMAKASAGKPALVIIDQLDAVSQYSGRTGSLFDRVSGFIQELRAHQLRHPIHLVIACREVDWRHDGRFRQLHRVHSDNKDEGIYKVEGLKDEEINTILSGAGYDVAAFSPRQRDLLLRRPQYLAVLIETSPPEDALKQIVTPKQLFDAYWTKKECALAEAFPSATNTWHEVLQCITEKLAETALKITPPVLGGDDEAPLAVKKGLIARFPPNAVRWLITNGVLAESESRIRFAHESLFDYCFARFFEERGQTLLDYLLHSDQTLIQRGQLRQVLAYQRDEEPALYLRSVRSLLDCADIRPHLRQLLATVICEVPDPTDAEWELIAPIIDAALIDIASENRNTTACQVFFAFHGSLPLFRISCEKGNLASWLQTKGPAAVNALFRTILCHQAKAQVLVWQIIAPLVHDERYTQALDHLSHFCHAAESRETFEWLLEMMRRVYESDEKLNPHAERFHSLVSDLAENKPEWLAEWLAAVIRERAKHRDEYSYDLVKDHHIESSRIGPSVARAPKAFLHLVLPSIEDALQAGEGRSFGTWSQYGDDDDHEGSIRYVSPDRAMFDSLVDALKQSLKTEADFTVAILAKLRNSSHVPMRRLHAAVLCEDEDDCAPLVAEFLTSDDNAFGITSGGKLAACTMIKKHAHRLPPTATTAIQSRILDCWPDYEKQKREYHDPNAPKTCLGNWRGYRQMVLLRAFPAELLLPTARQRLEQWERKFSSVETLWGPAYRDTPLNKEAVIGWQPARFLEGIKARRKRRRKIGWQDRDERDGKIGSLLTEAVSKRPDEFVRALHQCGDATPPAYISAIADGLSNLSLDSQVSFDAAQQFHRLGSQWDWSAVRLLQKIEAAAVIPDGFKLALELAQSGALPNEQHNREDGKRGDQLEAMASECVRGEAIEALAQFLWAAPVLVENLKPAIAVLMSEKHPAIQAQFAMVCYAIAFNEEHRTYATDTFVRLTNELSDEHVLSSRWPIKFMRAGLVARWDRFRPIIVRMMASESSEIRSAAARLVCIAVVSGSDAIDLARECAASPDPKVRAACADVLSYNLDVETGRPWTTEALLVLADDSDNDVCRTTGSGFYRNRRIDFGPLTELLRQYVKTRAFVRGTSGLIDAITGSHAVLPEVILDLVESILARLNEPVEDDADRLHWHLESLSPVLIRLYHENRDGSLRRRILNLIDKLCLSGGLKPEALDY